MGKSGITRGFTEMAPRLIFEHPFSTAVEIAKLALTRGVKSVAEAPVTSLATTLHHRYRAGRLPGVERAYGDGTSGSPYRYVADTSYIKASVKVHITLDVSYSVTGQQLAAKYSAEADEVRDALLSVVEKALSSPQIPEPYLTVFFDLADAHKALGR